jgi:hypothetical protein
MHSVKETGKTDHSRVLISEEMFSHFFMNILKGTVSEFANDKGIAYSLAYNLVHGRIKSISARDYKRIFGEKPPEVQPERVVGKYFRGMVRLWLFLNQDATKRDLYKEFYPEKKLKKVDSRIFSGKVKSVEHRLEKAMEQKFLDQGLDRAEIRRCIEELRQSEYEQRVPYLEAKPVLDYLRQVLNISSSCLLAQRIGRYKSGELKTIPMARYHDILVLKEKTDRILRSGSKFEIENVREEFCGRRDGMILFSEVEDELDFLREYGTKGTKKYLGRSVSHYKESRLRRIASWRAQKIRKDCHELIGKMPQIKLASLPRWFFQMKGSMLISVLKSCLIQKLVKDESGTYERVILMPSPHDIQEYKKEGYGFRLMDHAASALGMSKIAFDLMVATHADIFRRIARYNGRWYLSNLYIKALNKEEGFLIIKAKYEYLAKHQIDSRTSHEDERQDASSQVHRSCETGAMRDCRDGPRPVKQVICARSSTVSELIPT